MKTQEAAQIALSVRQPWAWMIIHGHKRIENRTWKTYYRGPLLIHAAGSMLMSDYRIAAAYAKERGVIVPAVTELDRGGIVGRCEMIDCVDHSRSKWFEGPFGFVLKDAEPLPFAKVAGQLGFFRVDALPWEGGAE